MMRAAAPLHDLGKIGVSENLLQKPARLTADGTANMKTHTTIGHRLRRACRSQYLIEGSIIALTHHEK